MWSCSDSVNNVHCDCFCEFHIDSREFPIVGIAIKRRPLYKFGNRKATVVGNLRRDFMQSLYES